MKLFLLLAVLLANLRGCVGQAPDAGTPAAAYSAPAYRADLRRWTARRTALALCYRRAATPAARAACLARARALLLAALDSTIFPAWEGTPWAFYGQTWEPRRGQIACGYFITTTLYDAGLRLQRSRLAKQASETIIKNLVATGSIRRYRETPQADFVAQVRQLGAGLYVVGLDFHVAYLRVYDDGRVQLVHATYLKPGTVVREPAETSRALASHYRVVGRLTADQGLLRHWLLGEALAVRGATVRE